MIGARPSNPQTHDLARALDARGAWPVLGAVLTHAHDHPDDPEAALLALRALVQIGQGALAQEAAARLPAEAASRPDARALRERARALPAGEFAPSDRVALGARNMDLLFEARGVDLRAPYRAWAEGEHAWRLLATPDGNVIRRPAADPDPRSWRWLAEHRAGARAFAAAHFARADREEIPPVAVEGFAPPWVFVEIARATPRLPSGYQPIIRVVQRDPAEFFEGASLIDLRSFIGDARVRWFVGDDAAERFEADVRAARGTQAVGAGAPVATLRTPIEPGLGELVNRLAADTIAETARARARVEARYEGRDAAWWAARYARALAPGSGEPLRVLIPTTRYSTYIRHAAHDLARAFERAGARASVLVEPDDHTRLGALAFHDAFEQDEPDLVVLINYPRSARAEVFPPGVPFVCWIQDEMPHLFTREAGAAQGPLDFVVGHAVSPLFDRYGYDPARALFSPVTVSEEKFHGAPITPAQRERFACDVAFVSNHAETPEAMHARKLAEVDDPRVRALLDRLRAEVEGLAGSLLEERATAALRAACQRALREAGAADPDPRDVHQYEIQYARPMLERLVRHRALATAADVCERRGWSLRVFGRGWEDHPRFGPLAGGVIEHGDDLRACHQAARVHLHPTALCLVHQRVMECALSGGLPVGVRSLAALPSLADLALAAGLMPGAASRTDEADPRFLHFDAIDHPAVALHAAMLQRLGAKGVPLPSLRMSRVQLDTLRAKPGARDGRAFTAPWLLGDPAELTFSTGAELEAVVERARDDDAWRASRSALIARRVRERATTSGLVQRTLGLIRESLEGAGALRRSA